MARKISISFKETRKDLELYDIINNLDDKSADLKNILRNYFKDELKSTTLAEVKKDNYVNEDVNVLDF
ncbi:hypothetical protein [Clostridium butyricum]|uniref:hypothetical protein n=1 Tax=Clostridium butyricum TaxID=1492 RepID=UPI00071E9E56|nr:hypothetical protein [Clostridium butyricum]ALR90187.1 circadian clock-controlled protein [Clostridium butyricum]ALS19072.1 circadian clock-controlled protein [Clostridium butyricum]ANF16259.1 circadian clock-controlled protein [Clostridium butyricum]AOR96170.1 circadian clock-controlled protein [Clostridium butyricum]MCI3010293.1 circadian clock-controlled protein [Clostridium butyricum]